MINKEDINENLWSVIKIHYLKECYTDSLKDACLYLIQLIQEKSELEDLDGEKLITNVFSESNPKLLINNNKSQSEKDAQRGFGFLLRGIVCAIRNPISHDINFKFTKKETDSILLFINNFILPKLDDSKDFGYVNNWFEFIFVNNENYSKKYSETVLENIPKKKRLNLMFSVIENLDSIAKNKYSYFINILYNSLLRKEKQEVIIALNKKLIEAGDNDYLKSFFNNFTPEIWNDLDNLVKIRIEEIVLKSIRSGKVYSDFSGNIKKSDSLGVWAIDWILKFSNKNDIIDLLYEKLNVKDESEYVLTYFINIVQETQNLEKKSEIILNGLKNGKIGYKKLLDNIMFFDDGSDQLILKFRDAYNSFKEEIDDPFEDLQF